MDLHSRARLAWLRVAQERGARVEPKRTFAFWLPCVARDEHRAGAFSLRLTITCGLLEGGGEDVTAGVVSQSMRRTAHLLFA